MAVADIIHTTTGAPAELADELTALAKRLNYSTVQVRGDGPGGGSGVIWRADGLIITNAHVARGSQARVDLSDGRTLPAIVMARDERRDLAALQVEASDLPAAAIGDSDALRVGELVLATGNPLGMVGAVTAGIIHAIGPDTSGTAQGPSRRRRWVQADVRLAPGNSGGPLADARGQVIGINSMISGGLALAVPSNDVERFLQSGEERPYLGVMMQPVLVPARDERLFGLMVLETAPGGPAAQAGLITGDIIVGVDGVLFRGPGDLGAALDGAGPGGTLALDLLRGGRRLRCTVTVARGPAPGAQAA